MLNNLADIVSLLIITIVIYFIATVLISLFTSIVWIAVGIALYYLTQNPLTVNGLIAELINYKFSGVYQRATQYIESFKTKGE